jgi:hypothetical protein
MRDALANIRLAFVQIKPPVAAEPTSRTREARPWRQMRHAAT